MTIKVTLDEYSLSNASGDELLTYVVQYPRFIHPEVLRHRQLSHSVASSRAIPVMRNIRNVLSDPATPVEWGSNKPGMQAGPNLSAIPEFITRVAWHTARYAAVSAAYVAARAGAHKQIANRIIEPWTHTVEVISGTDWESFFSLRISEFADPTIRELALEMRRARNRKTPRILNPGEWHLPLITDAERRSYSTEILRDVSAGRCARASYLNHDRSNPSVAEDLNLAARLRKDHHWSPFEQQATPDACNGFGNTYGTPQLHGNFTGFNQNRKIWEEALL
jgi:thymidylate synthase ThyX